MSDQDSIWSAERLDLLAKGDPKEWTAFYDENAPRMRAWARKFVRDEDSADDLVQRIFAREIQRPALFASRLRAYRSHLNLLVRWEGLSSIKRTKHLREQLLPDGLDRTEEADLFSEDILGDIFGFVEQLAAQGKLTDHQHQVLMMFFRDGLSNGEISDRLGCRDSAVTTTRQRALRVIRYELGVDQSLDHG